MLKHRYIDAICITAAVLALVITLLFIFGGSLGLIPANTAPGYEIRLFDDSRVHEIDLEVDDWDTFIANADAEEYIEATVTIDGERYERVGLRTKGNNSRRLTAEYGLQRHSLKIEFDHYIDTYTYHGLDKFSLDSSFQDNSYMKTSLVYDMMDYMGVPTPLTSYVWVTVNGEPWGLFLAVEEPEESFARRVYGDSYGKLYKPDYLSLSDENADIDLRYIDDAFESYENIFRNAKFDITDTDKSRLIKSLEVLSTGEDLESVVNIDEVTRYFAVQVFVLNLDSYIGTTGHNYFLYEDDGILSMLPWDYNLAFGTYCLGMTDPIRDPNALINMPIGTPWKGEEMMKRPLFHNLMKYQDCFSIYRGYLAELATDYVQSGRCELFIRETEHMISPYVERDPTAFCNYDDFSIALDTLLSICETRATAVLGQIEGIYPSTISAQNENPGAGVDASHIDFFTLGDFKDLKNAQNKNQ